MLFGGHSKPTTPQWDPSEDHYALRDVEWHDRRQQNGPPFQPSVALARNVPKAHTESSLHLGHMLILDNHVVHDHTSVHYVPKHLLIPKSSRSSHNSKLGLQNPKSSLHIFSSRRLSIVEIKIFLTFRLFQRLHKCLPLWVDAIRRIVAIVVRTAICYKLH